jgi:hypothetical protein
VSGRHSADGDAAPASQVAGVRITGGDPTAEEIAAVTAVLSAALAAISEQDRSEDPGTTGWDRSRRAPRRRPTPGGWTDWAS